MVRKLLFKKIEKQKNLTKGAGGSAMAAWGLLLVAAACLLIDGRDARAERWLPDEGHYRARDTVDDCRVFRKLMDKLTSQIHEQSRTLQSVADSLKEDRLSVEDCGAKQGGLSPNSDPQLLADLCPDSYNNWVDHGTSYRAIRDDMEDARQSIGQLRNLLDRCTFNSKR